MTFYRQRFTPDETFCISNNELTQDLALHFDCPQHDNKVKRKNDLED